MATTANQITDEFLPLEGFDAASTAIFESVFALYGVLDEGGHILDLRGRIFTETSAKPELLIRQPFSETVFWQSSEANVRIIEKAIESATAGEAVRLLLDFRMSADQKRAVELSFQPIRSPDGESRIFVSGRPTNEDAAGSANQIEVEQFLLAAEIAYIGLWYWDHVGGRVYSTPRANELFELATYEELTYDKVLRTIHPDDRAYVEEFFERTLEKGSKYEEEFRVLYSDGRIEWLRSEGKSYLSADGKPERMVGTIRSITEQKQAAEDLERVYEREKKARDEAEIANRAKDFFLAFVSHELRSPLNAILGWSKILLTREVNEETRRKALETIEKSALVQTKLINDLVDSARVASGKLRLEYRQVNLVDIVRSSFEAQKPAAENVGLGYRLDTDRDQIVVFGDAGRLQQVFGNLLSNAIKFTPAGGEVLVEVKVSEDSAVVSVSDSGQGIDPKGLTDIFKQFAQGDTERTRRGGGLGLGLSIVNILVAKHGGKVRAESDGLGRGSRFTVTLPLNVDQQQIDISDAPNRQETAKRLKGFNILIVEDDPDSREVLQLFLEQSGASVRTAESARAAMSIFTDPRAPRPDVLISDLAMPEEDGYSLIARIRELPEELGGHIPALALSAFASVESRQRAFEAGFHRYLTKPFEPESMVDQIVSLRGLNGNGETEEPASSL